MPGQKLAGRSVLVTGGGTGIGAACALMAAREGARVTICGRTEAKLLDTAARIRAEGGAVLAVPADVTVEDDVARLISAAADFGVRGMRHSLRTALQITTTELCVMF